MQKWVATIQLHNAKFAIFFHICKQKPPRGPESL